MKIFKNALYSVLACKRKTIVKCSPQNNFIIRKNDFSPSEAVPDFHSIGLACGLVDEHPGDGGVEHDVQVRALLSGPQEGARCAQPRPVAVRGLRDRETRVVHAV